MWLILLGKGVSTFAHRSCTQLGAIALSYILSGNNHCPCITKRKDKGKEKKTTQNQGWMICVSLMS